jgi:hypothetical protein
MSYVQILLQDLSHPTLLAEAELGKIGISLEEEELYANIARVWIGISMLHGDFALFKDIEEVAISNDDIATRYLNYLEIAKSSFLTKE